MEGQGVVMRGKAVPRMLLLLAWIFVATSAFYVADLIMKDPSDTKYCPARPPWKTELDVDAAATNS